MSAGYFGHNQNRPAYLVMKKQNKGKNPGKLKFGIIVVDTPLDHPLEIPSGANSFFPPTARVYQYHLFLEFFSFIKCSI